MKNLLKHFDYIHQDFQIRFMTEHLFGKVIIKKFNFFILFLFLLYHIKREKNMKEREKEKNNNISKRTSSRE